jgi:hypothetical protein
VAYECVPRPTCPACGAEWDDEMIALFETVLGLGCSCCAPMPFDPPDIACHKCKKVLYSAQGTPSPAADAPLPGELDMSPRE